MRWLWVVVLVAPAAMAGCLNDFSETHGASAVRIVGIDVSAPVVKSGSMVLAVNTTLDNADARSGDIRLIVKAYDQATGLLAATQEAEVGEIPQDKTVAVEVLVDVPRASGYRLEVLVHQSDRLALTAVVTASNLDALAPNVFDTGLRVSTIDFIVRNVTGERVAITAKVYVTNEAAAVSKPLSMQVKAREVSTGILADEQEESLPSVQPEQTHAAEVLLSVPDSYNYQVEVVLWDGNIIVERGSGNVQLLPTFTKDPDEEIVVTDPQVEDFVRDRTGGGGGDSGDATRTPSIGILAAAAAVGLAVAIHRRTQWRQ